jgi:hypothetical protein
MKNRYGGPLRNLVAERFHLENSHVDMVGYPGISFRCGCVPGHYGDYPGSAEVKTRIAHRPAIDRATLTKTRHNRYVPIAPAEGRANSVRELARRHRWR